MATTRPSTISKSQPEEKPAHNVLPEDRSPQFQPDVKLAHGSDPLSSNPIIAYLRAPIKHEPCEVLLRRFHSKVAGITHNNSDGTSRQRTIRNCFVDEPLLLRPEPRNQFDPNAVAVFRTTGDQIGYINANLAVDVSEWLADKRLRVEACITEITGARFGKYADRGVNILITVHSLPPVDGPNLTISDEITVALNARDLPRLLKTLERPPPSLSDRRYHIGAVFSFAARHRTEPCMRELCDWIVRLYIAEFGKLNGAGKKAFPDGPPTPCSVLVAYSKLLTDEGKFDEAVRLCLKAIEIGAADGTKTGFTGRIQRIRKNQQRVARGS